MRATWIFKTALFLGMLAGCSSNPDNLCGNQTMDPGETCDPPDTCPTGCDDFDSCTLDTMSGSADLCNVACHHDPVTACNGGDGCCPSGCNKGNDSDCALCKDGIVDLGETCGEPGLPVCPTNCDDGIACTTDTMTGSPDRCNTVCVHQDISACLAGDGCCPNNCKPQEDGDCSDSCGDGVLDLGETCDPPASCATACASDNVCATGVLTGMAGHCNVQCVYQPIANCSSGDGCCPNGCTVESDEDCTPFCGNGAVDSGEECDDGNDVQWDGCSNCRISEFTVAKDPGHAFGSARVAVNQAGEIVFAWKHVEASINSSHTLLFHRNGRADDLERQVSQDIFQSPVVSMNALSYSLATYEKTKNDTALYMRRLALGGSSIMPPIMVSSANEKVKSYSAAMDDTSRFAVAWMRVDKTTYSSFLQWFLADGSQASDALSLRSSAGTISALEPTVVMTGSGKAVAVWRETNADVYAQQFGENGASPGVAQKVNGAVAAGIHTSVAINDTGSFVVVWSREDSAPTYSEIYFRIFDSTGNAQTSDVRVNPITDELQLTPQVAMDSAERFVIAWASKVGSVVNIRAQRFNTDGSALGDSFIVNVSTEQSSSPFIAMRPSGEFVITWIAQNAMAQRFDANGTPIGRKPW